MRRTRRQRSAAGSDDDSSVLVLDRQRFQPVDRNTLTQIARSVLHEIGHSQSRATIMLVGDRRIQTLNRDYRALDQPTDVLSFPNEPDFPHEVEAMRDLGDVVISTETAARYAAKFRISFERELGNLIIHGLLHLCGYDHETDQGEMRRLERRLRKKLSALGVQPSAKRTPKLVQSRRSSAQPQSSGRAAARTKKPKADG